MESHDCHIMKGHSTEEVLFLKLEVVSDNNNKEFNKQIQ